MVMLKDMKQIISIFKRHIIPLTLVLVFAGGLNSTVFAANPGPTSNSAGLQATIPSPPPTQSASISTPSNGDVFTSTPITFSGLCPNNLLIKAFDNNVFVGSTICSNSSFSMKIDLFSGTNDLVAKDYDSLDQAGPDSSNVTVTFNDAQFAQFGTQVTLSSAYAERGAPPGQELDWPLVLNGGNGPFALSVDWGDGSSSDLYSVQTSGSVTIKHSYRTAGVYAVVVKVTDVNGDTAFLQLVGQATGAITNTAGKAGTGTNGSG